jgi:hypothetical protein
LWGAGRGAAMGTKKDSLEVLFSARRTIDFTAARPINAFSAFYTKPGLLLVLLTTVRTTHAALLIVLFYYSDCISLSRKCKEKCERGDLNPYGLTRWILSPVRLPVPPLSRCLILKDFPFTCQLLKMVQATGLRLQGTSRRELYVSPCTLPPAP